MRQKAGGETLGEERKRERDGDILGFWRENVENTNLLNVLGNFSMCAQKKNIKLHDFRARLWSHFAS